MNSFGITVDVSTGGKILFDFTKGAENRVFVIVFKANEKGEKTASIGTAILEREKVEELFSSILSLYEEDEE